VSSAACQELIMATNGGNDASLHDDTRRRSSRTVSPMPPRRLDNANNDARSPEKKKLRVSPRLRFKNCCDINGLDRKLCCSGCIHFKDFGSKPRNEHSSSKCQCYKAWERDEKTIEKRMQSHFEGVMAYINHHMNIDPSVLKKVNTPKPPAKPKESSDNGVTPSPPQPEPEREQEVEMISNEDNSEQRKRIYN